MAPVSDDDAVCRVIATASLSFVLTVAHALSELQLMGRDTLCIYVLGADCEVRCKAMDGT